MDLRSKLQTMDGEFEFHADLELDRQSGHENTESSNNPEHK